MTLRLIASLASFRRAIFQHRASDENANDAYDATLETARIVSEFGVPPAIVGKLVLTPPDQMAWLSPDDLRSMSVTIASGLRWPGTAVASGDAAAVKLDGLNDLGPGASFTVDKDDPAAMVTTFEDKRVKIIRSKVCRIDLDGCLSWGTLDGW